MQAQEHQKYTYLQPPHPQHFQQPQQSQQSQRSQFASPAPNSGNQFPVSTGPGGVPGGGPDVSIHMNGGGGGTPYYSQPSDPFSLSQSQSQGGGNFTRVNGIGIWESWRKNFRSPLFALLDLFDNAIDASFELDHGKISVRTCTTNNEMVLKNNCSHRICPIQEILELYKSNKDTSTIGQNGIGTKQACANLCDLSIVLTKNETEISMGVIAKFLQTEQGPYLPSTSFVNPNECGTDFDQQLRVLNWDKVYSEYGRCHSDNQNNNGASTVIHPGGTHNDKERGIERIHKHIQDLMDDPDPFVFKVILHQVRHNRTELLNELKDELPMYYIHVPRTFQIMINHQKVHFSYWESRLVELSAFEAFIHPEILWHQQTDWKNDTDGNKLRVFCGFDPYRTEKREATLYIYSRRSGRLVKQVDDCRTYLHLTTGSSTFCQGLTVLVDDYTGCLPLTPTKQDLAFSMEDHGQTHETNFEAWVSAYVHMYYVYHYAKFGERKEMLANAIEEAGEELDQIKEQKLLEQKEIEIQKRGSRKQGSFSRHFSNENDDGDDSDSDDDEANGVLKYQKDLPFLTRSLAEGSFTTLTNLTWKGWRSEKIRVYLKNTVVRESHEDTLVHLRHLDARELSKAKKPVKRKHSMSQPTPEQMVSSMSPMTQTQSQSQTISPSRTSQQDDSDDTANEDEDSGPSKRAKRAERRSLRNQAATANGGNEMNPIVIADDDDDNGIPPPESPIIPVQVSSSTGGIETPRPRQKMISNKELTITVRKLRKQLADKEASYEDLESKYKESQSLNVQLMDEIKKANDELKEVEKQRQLQQSTNGDNDQSALHSTSLEIELQETQDKLQRSEEELKAVKEERETLREANEQASRQIKLMKTIEADSQEEINILRRKITNLQQLA